MYLILAATLLSLLVSVGILRWKARQNYWEKLGVPVSTVPGIVKGFTTGNVYFDTEVYKELKGNPYGGFMELWNPIFFVMDLELVKNICIKDFDHFVDRRGFNVGSQDPHMFHSLLNQKGDAWRKLRAFMSPAFTTKQMKRMFSLFNESAEKMTMLMRRTARVSPEFDIREFHQKVTMDTIAGTAFGIQTDIFENPESVFMKMGQKIIHQFDRMGIVKLMFTSFFPKLGEILKVKVTNEDADRFLTKIIQETLRRREATGEKREDFLQLMIEARDKTMKEDEENWRDGNSRLEVNDDLIIAQCLVFLLGGYDTVEALLIWCTYELARDSEIQERLHQEVKKAYDENDKCFSYESIHSMEYLERFIQETLRLYPAPVRFERLVTKDYTVPGTDLVLPKNSVVAIPVYSIHRDPEYWEDAEKFDPDRFLPEQMKERHPCAYIPFGVGPRFCIGNRYALEEAKVVVANLALNFKFETCEKTPFPIKYETSGPLKPDGAMWLKVIPRW